MVEGADCWVFVSVGEKSRLDVDVGIGVVVGVGSENVSLLELSKEVRETTGVGDCVKSVNKLLED